MVRMTVATGAGYPVFYVIFGKRVRDMKEKQFG